jgi:hypothetical protein
VKPHFTSTDLDGDGITHMVWNCKDVSTIAASVDYNTEGATKKVSKKAKPNDKVHIIVEGTDAGTPALTRFRRVIFKVE